MSSGENGYSLNSFVPERVKSSRFRAVHAWTFLPFSSKNEDVPLNRFLRWNYKYDRKCIIYRIVHILKLQNQTLMCEPQKTDGRFDQKKFFWLFMLRRLFSVFRDAKKFFLKFFLYFFFEFRSLLTHSCFLFRQIISLWTGSMHVCIIS